MSDTTNSDAPDPHKPSIFDERPGLGVEDDPSKPEAILPEVIAPDLNNPTPFDDRPKF